MNLRTLSNRLLLELSFCAFVVPGFTYQAPTPRESEEARDFKIFAERAQEYVKMQKALKASLPPLNPTKDAARILEHQHALARKIADARRDARQGDVFTPEVTKRFRKIIDKTLHGPEGRLARATIRPDPQSKLLALHVNDVCPEEIPLTTSPPTLLARLPKLPQELTYRIVGHDLTLQDTEARLIVDLIPAAIP
jgi:hypothetical protein